MVSERAVEPKRLEDVHTVLPEVDLWEQQLLRHDVDNKEDEVERKVVFVLSVFVFRIV